MRPLGGYLGLSEAQRAFLDSMVMQLLGLLGATRDYGKSWIPGLCNLWGYLALIWRYLGLLLMTERISWVSATWGYLWLRRQTCDTGNPGFRIVQSLGRLGSAWSCLRLLRETLGFRSNKQREKYPQIQEQIHTCFWFIIWQRASINQLMEKRREMAG